MARPFFAMPETPSAYDILDRWLCTESPPKRFVYVLRAEGDSPIKVGKATSVRSRMASIQTGNPRRLTLLRVVPGWTELEWQLHFRLRDCRLSGEWFDGDEIPAFLALMERLSDYMRAGFAETGGIPDFMRFESGWARRGKRQSIANVSFLEPDPADVAHAAEVRRRQAEPREFEASPRHKAEFAMAHSEPVFSRHKRS